MAKFQVLIYGNFSALVTVEAENEDDARDKIEDMSSEIGDIVKIDG